MSARGWRRISYQLSTPTYITRPLAVVLIGEKNGSLRALAQDLFLVPQVCHAKGQLFVGERRIKRRQRALGVLGVDNVREGVLVKVATTSDAAQVNLGDVDGSNRRCDCRVNPSIGGAVANGDRLVVVTVSIKSTVRLSHGELENVGVGVRGGGQHHRLWQAHRETSEGISLAPTVGHERLDQPPGGTNTAQRRNSIRAIITYTSRARMCVCVSLSCHDTPPKPTVTLSSLKAHTNTHTQTKAKRQVTHTHTHTQPNTNYNSQLVWRVNRCVKSIDQVLPIDRGGFKPFEHTKTPFPRGINTARNRVFAPTYKRTDKNLPHRPSKPPNRLRLPPSSLQRQPPKECTPARQQPPLDTRFHSVRRTRRPGCAPSTHCVRLLAVPPNSPLPWWAGTPRWASASPTRGGTA